jgi:glutamate N-acetyltransferase/amino-acid N-acetyltransferase
VPSGSARAIVINAGNANAATGDAGRANVARTARLVAEHVGCDPDDVLAASTGVIGRQLPMDRLELGLAEALANLSGDIARFEDASRAILTTDTRPKVVSFRETIDDLEVVLFGMAKGAAMIGPNMATMLGFLLTDAPVKPRHLQEILGEAVEDSFNCISVEGHTSTNDSVLILANGGSRPTLRKKGRALLADLVHRACTDLARMIPEDGEGATHLITVTVGGCRDRNEARRIAKNVANDALVKTAIHGADPNWGRIASAAGYSGVEFDESELALWLNGIPLYRDGAPVEFDADAVSQKLRSERNVDIRLVFERGNASIRFWTTDLTAEYVRLNADYTT